MIDITTINDLGNITEILNIKYRFNGFDYLVADKYWNFYTLPHCPNKRLIPFKIHGKRKLQGYVYYHKDKKYRNNLMRRRIVVNERFVITN